MKLIRHYLEWILIGLILVLYAITALAYAVRTPDWQVPDETAHYNYIRQIAETGELPVIEMGDWRQDYQNMMTSCNFHPAIVYADPSRVDNVPYLEACGYTPDPTIVVGYEAIQYEDHQPPLYYLLQTPIYLATDGDLTAMRMFSALLGGIAVWGAWATVRRLFPEIPWLALTTAAIVAFIPQRLAIMGGVSNDSLAEGLAALVMLGVVHYLSQVKPSGRLLFAIGVGVGLIFLTKSTVYFVSGIAGIAVLMRWWREKWSLKFALWQMMLLAIPAVALGLIWWVHSIDVYGGMDFLGLQRHDEVVVGQLRTDDYIDNYLDGSQRLYWDNLTRTTFQSYWGQFGWMAYPMQPRIYQVLRILVFVLMLGAVVGGGRLSRSTRWQREYFILWGITIILVTSQFGLYNTSFVQFQGRYLYPALIPFAFLLAYGFYSWVNLVAKRIDVRLNWATLLLGGGMLVFAWYALRNVISAMPNWG